MERTFAIVKPDAVRRGYTERIFSRIRASGLRVLAWHEHYLSRAEAEQFYDVHRGRPFFNGLCEFMTSGPVVVAVLEGDHAIRKWRGLMGATDPKMADIDTIRRDFGTDVEKNATHGSDAPGTAAREIRFFFPELA